MKKKWIIMVISLQLVCGCGSIPRRVWKQPDVYSEYLAHDSAFVRYPTVAGIVIGLPTVIISVSLSPLCEPSGGKEDINVLLLGPTVVGDVVGTPFLVIKRVLWDCPKSVFTRTEEKDAADHLQEDRARKLADPQQ